MKNKKFYSKLYLGIAVFLLVITSFVIGNYTGQQGISLGIVATPVTLTNTDSGKPASVDFSTFWEAWNKLNSNYVSSLDSQKLVYGAITGLLESTGDPYTEFLTPDENKRFKEDFSGNFDGIGVELTSVDGQPTVVSPLSGSPAEKAGLKPKDIISEVDGAKTSDIGFEETINRIRGEKGTTVKLTVVRTGEDTPLQISVVRENITVASVTSETKTKDGSQIAYIKVSQFGDDTEQLFNKAVNDAKSQNAKAVIVDLRNNPGGYLETAVAMSSDFLSSGVVVSEVDKNGKKKDFNVSQSVIMPDAKLIILVNSGSASASEIMAGALKDHKRATIIGEKSFGKGSVQVMENLSDNSAVKITIAKWLTPNGDHIDKVGITPDIEVKASDSQEDVTLNRALEEAVK